MHGSAAVLGPGDDVIEMPDAAHREPGDGFGEVVALGELIDAGASDAEDLGEFLAADEVLHPLSIDTCLVCLRDSD